MHTEECGTFIFLSSTSTSSCWRIRCSFACPMGGVIPPVLLVWRTCLEKPFKGCYGGGFITSPNHLMWMLDTHWNAGEVTFPSCKVRDLCAQAALPNPLRMKWKPQFFFSLRLKDWADPRVPVWCYMCLKYSRVTFLPLSSHSRPDWCFQMWAQCQRYSALRHW